MSASVPPRSSSSERPSGKAPLPDVPGSTAAITSTGTAACVTRRASGKLLTRVRMWTLALSGYVVPVQAGCSCQRFQGRRSSDLPANSRQEHDLRGADCAALQVPIADLCHQLEPCNNRVVLTKLHLEPPVALCDTGDQSRNGRKHRLTVVCRHV